MKKILLSIFAIITAISGYSQNYYTFNLYNTNPLLYNPAHYVHNEKLIIYTDTRLQWMNIPGAPKISSLGFAYSKNNKMGYGLKLVNNNVGMFNFFNATAGYSYKAQLGTSDHFIKMGLDAGVSNNFLLRQNAQNVDLSDITLSNNYYRKIIFTTDIGISYNYQNLQLDVMLPQIYDDNIFFRQAMAMASYSYQLNEDVSLTPSVLVRTGQEVPFTSDFNLMATWKKQLWTQISYRSNKGYIFSLGTSIDKIHIGYAFEYANNKITAASYGTHEIQIIYKMGNKPKIKKIQYSGKITDQTTQQPVNSTVKIYQNNELLETLKTDEEGSFTVKLKEGQTYNINIIAPDYYGINENITLVRDSSATYKEYKLVPKTIIVVGKVTDSISNEGVSGVDIEFLSGNKIIKQTTTNANGGYHVKIDRNSDFNIVVSAKNYSKAEATINTNTNQDSITKNFTVRPVITIHGRITDSDIDAGLGATIDIVDPTTNKIIKQVVSDSQTGEYSVKLTGYKDVQLVVNSTGYMFQAVDVHIPKTNADISENIALQKLNQGVSIVLENVVFDKGKSTLRPESIPEIDRVIQVMKANPDIKIELSGHTDSYGNMDYNIKLSKERAQAVADYMISKGISPDRLVVVGYGPKKPRDTNTTPQGRERNRRVEAKVIK